MLPSLEPYNPGNNIKLHIKNMLMISKITKISTWIIDWYVDTVGDGTERHTVTLLDWLNLLNVSVSGLVRFNILNWTNCPKLLIKIRSCTTALQ